MIESVCVFYFEIKIMERERERRWFGAVEWEVR